MASEFYQITGGDEALLVGPGQAHCRKLGITSAALNMRVGFMLSFCKTDDKNNALTSAQSDSISLASPHLGLLVGLRSYGTSLVNTTGQYFYGIGTATNTVSGASSNAFSENLGFVLYKNGVSQGTNGVLDGNIAVPAGVNCTYVGMKLVAGTYGTRTAISLQRGTTNDAPTVANLTTLLANHVRTYFNEALDLYADNYPHLDSIYIQNPFVNCYIRVHAYGFMMGS